MLNAEKYIKPNQAIGNPQPKDGNKKNGISDMSCFIGFPVPPVGWLVENALSIKSSFCTLISVQVLNK